MPVDYWTSTFLPLLIFTLASSFTPGPNLVMITASGANFGWRRSLPHYWGIVLGFSGMVLAIALGLGTIFESVPWLHTVLKYVGAAYLLWLGLRIATARRTASGTTRGRPFSFVEAALFQWVNPKAWLMAVGAVAAFARTDMATWVQALPLTAVMGVISFISCALYLGGGVAIGRWLESPLAFRVFNLLMGGLTIASVVLLFM